MKWLDQPRTKAAQVFSSGVEMCLMDREMNQLHQMVTCRAFIADCVWAQVMKKQFKYQGFKYKPVVGSSFSPYTSMRLLVTDKSSNDLPIAGKAVLQALTRIESANGINTSCAWDVTGPDGEPALLLKADDDWMMSPQMVHMYTWLVRILLKCPEYESAEDFFANVVMESWDVVRGHPPQHRQDVILTYKYWMAIDACLFDGRMDTLRPSHALTSNWEKFKECKDVHDVCFTDMMAPDEVVIVPEDLL